MEKLEVEEPTVENVDVSKPNKLGLFVVYVTVFVDVLGFGIIIPLLPFFAVEMGANGFLLGVMVSSFAFFRSFLFRFHTVFSNRKC